MTNDDKEQLEARKRELEAMSLEELLAFQKSMVSKRNGSMKINLSIEEIKALEEEEEVASMLNDREKQLALIEKQIKANEAFQQLCLAQMKEPWWQAEEEQARRQRNIEKTKQKLDCLRKLVQLIKQIDNLEKQERGF